MRNDFNEENRTAILWAVRHKWPRGAWFAFNCYRHWATLVIRAGDETGQLLYSKEGVTHGDPLAIVVYGLGNPPSSRNCGRPTTASHRPGMRMNLGQEAHSREYVSNLMT